MEASGFFIKSNPTDINPVDKRQSHKPCRECNAPASFRQLSNESSSFAKSTLSSAMISVSIVYKSYCPSVTYTLSVTPRLPIDSRYWPRPIGEIHWTQIIEVVVSSPIERAHVVIAVEAWEIVLCWVIPPEAGWCARAIVTSDGRKCAAISRRRMQPSSSVDTWTTRLVISEFAGEIRQRLRSPNRSQASRGRARSRQGGRRSAAMDGHPDVCQLLPPRRVE